jgi:hypothetical protein
MNLDTLMQERLHEQELSKMIFLLYSTRRELTRWCWTSIESVNMEVSESG